ncbi:MAG: hypothetical protein NC231_12560 [Bacillus sp. (in: Bacteria)]|nr:hypothetical protein [Bacillus sp. (in: firmicutes)]
MNKKIMILIMAATVTGTVLTGCAGGGRHKAGRTDLYNRSLRGCHDRRSNGDY